MSTSSLTDADQALQYPADLSLTELFLRAVSRDPGATAVVGQEETLSYAELDQRSSRLASRLRARGVRDGSSVGLLIERSVELVTALLAVVKAGGCYVVLDHKQPPARSAALLKDAGATVLVTRGQHEIAEFDGVQQISIDNLSAATELAESAPVTSTDLDSLVYIAYTSGSTGSPKGVCVPQRAVIRLVIDAKYLPIRVDDVFLQLAPVAFDASTLEIWGALLNGATLVVAPASEFTIAELTRFIRDHSITVLFLTSGLFHQLGQEEFERLRCLRYLITGGEVISVQQVNRAAQALPRSVVIHAYGPTENTTFTTCYPIKEPVASTFVPLGGPIDGSRIYLLDTKLNPVPIGAAGELFTAGAGLAHGYVNSPALTAERFLPDPFAGSPGAYMYRTGDLARQHEDGSIEFLGRADTQIKVRGFRVEPAEIEVALQAHPDIATPCVVLQDVPGAEKRLVAFYVSDEVIPTAELRQTISERLPSYMIPARFSRLEALPLKPNGKVDRLALTQFRENERPYVGSDFRGPETPVERWLSELWSDLLEIREVGVDDDFFELGGHSLLAIRITGIVNTMFGFHVSPQAFYENPTVAELAALLDNLGVKSAIAAEPGES